MGREGEKEAMEEERRGVEILWRGGSLLEDGSVKITSQLTSSRREDL